VARTRLQLIFHTIGVVELLEKSEGICVTFIPNRLTL